MTSRPVAEPSELARYLLSFRWPYQNEANYPALVAGGLPLWGEILRRVPDAEPGGHALELGSPPFHLTLLLKRVRGYALTLTGSTTDGRSEIVQTLDSAAYDEHHVMTCHAFDLERDRFPFPDAHFDLVTFCEVIEHLTENPVHTLSEIHRVLRPGGRVLISTPNVSRAGNISNLLQGRNIYDPYHLGAPLRGSRHSREFTLAELRDLVAGCGFAVELAEDADLRHPIRPLRRLLRWLMNTVIGPLLGGHHRTHLFVRGRRTDAPFRWYFPEDLFDPGQLAFHHAPRSRAVVMGTNDVGHAVLGWGPLVHGAAGRLCRHCTLGDLLLIDDALLRHVGVTLSGGTGTIEAWHEVGGPVCLLGSVPFDVPGGEWRTVDVPLSADYRPGQPVHLRIVAPAGVAVHAATAHSTEIAGDR
jgi:SAM-dependent methyltransferase